MKKILLIEDEEMAIELYEEVFKKANFEIESLRFGFRLDQLHRPAAVEELIKEGIDKFLVKTDYTPSRLVNLVREALSR